MLTNNRQRAKQRQNRLFGHDQHATEGDKFIGLIPARAGSKRLKHKHTRLLGSQPMINHSFEGVCDSRRLHTTFVSTDCSLIAKLADNYGLSLAHDGLRSSDLAQHDTPSIDVIRAFITWYHDTIDEEAFNLVLLQPTSPLRTPLDIDAACQQFSEQARGSSLISVAPTKPPQWQGWVSPNGLLNGIQPQAPTYPKQHTIQHSVQLNGAIYIANSRPLMNFSFLEMPAFAFEMKASQSIDIDTLDDLQLAEAILRQQQHHSNTKERTPHYAAAKRR